MNTPRPGYRQKKTDASLGSTPGPHIRNKLILIRIMTQLVVETSPCLTVRRHPESADIEKAGAALRGLSIRLRSESIGYSAAIRTFGHAQSRL